MTLKFKGKVWIFGDNLDVDKDIIPFRKMNLGLITFDNLGDWCMTNMCVLLARWILRLCGKPKKL